MLLIRIRVVGQRSSGVLQIALLCQLSVTELLYCCALGRRGSGVTEIVLLIAMTMISRPETYEQLLLAQC